MYLKTHICVSMYVVCLYISYQKYSKMHTDIELVRKLQVFLSQVLYYTSRGSNDKYIRTFLQVWMWLQNIKNQVVPLYSCNIEKNTLSDLRKDEVL